MDKMLTYKLAHAIKTTNRVNKSLCKLREAVDSLYPGYAAVAKF